MRLKAKIAAVLLAVALMFGGMSAATAPTALAGECSGWNLCGKVWNQSHVGITIAHHWGGHEYRTLWPGQRSTAYWRDTDGFYVGRGWCARVTYYNSPGYSLWYGSGWHKISDNYNDGHIAAWRC